MRKFVLLLFLMVSIYSLSREGYPQGFLISPPNKTPPSSQSVSQTIYKYPHNPNYLVLQFSRKYDLLANGDNTPILRLYGDGRLLIHHPRGSKKAGDYILWLTPNEVQQLLAKLDRLGVMKMTARSGESVQTRLQAATTGGQLFEISDATHSIVEVHVTRVNRGLNGVFAEPVNNRVQMSNVLELAPHHPEIPELQAMAGAEKLFEVLLERKDAKKITGPGN